MKKLIHHAYFIPWLIFIFFTTIYFSSTVGIMNSGDGPQYALTQALVEEHTIAINHFSKWTYPDFSLYKGNMYSQRTIGESLSMVPFYIIAKSLLPFANFPYGTIEHRGIDSDSKLEALTSLGNSTFGAILMMLVYLLTLKITANKKASFITAIITGLGSLFWRYSGQMVRFPTASFFLFLSFYLYYMILMQNKKPTIYKLILIGTTFGLTIFIDLSFLFVVIIFLMIFIIHYISSKFPTSKLAYLIVAFFLPICLLLIYNYLAFENPFTSAYAYHGVKPYYRNVSIYYSTPLFPSLFINLFSLNPVPKEAFAPSLWNNTLFRNNEGYVWATIYNYSGIFNQSPVLYFSLIGFLIGFRKNKKIIALILLIAFLFIIQMSKYIFFFGGNARDTHYFLPAIPFLMIGLSIWLNSLFRLKNIYLKSFLTIITAVLAGISVYNGWYANITNYAPHLTGEHRFNPEVINLSISSINNFVEVSKIILINTFPNIFNLTILLPYFLICIFVYKIIFTIHKKLSHIESPKNRGVNKKR